MSVSFSAPGGMACSVPTGQEPESALRVPSVQPHGAVLVVRETDLRVMRASANARQVLGCAACPCGQTLDSLAPGLPERLRPHLHMALRPIPLALRARLGHSLREPEFDILVHRPESGQLVVEFERAHPPLECSAQVHQALQAIIASTSIAELGEATTRVFQQLTGYDRVLLYRLDQDGHGEVTAETCTAALPSLNGRCYPGSCIPPLSRAPARRPRVRLLVDVDSEDVPLVAAPSAGAAEPVDLSLCTLRSVSPLYRQILRRLGVHATLVASLMVGDTLWGFIACHHHAPRFVPYEMRALCELLAESVATRLAALENFVQSQAEVTVRRFERDMIDAISCEGDWKPALFRNAQTLLRLLDAGGLALLCDQQIRTAGRVPDEVDLQVLAGWLDVRSPSGLYVTTSLAREAPAFAALTPVASGVVALPLSRGGGEYLLWFRSEQLRTLTCDLAPDSPEVRLLHGNCSPWTTGQLTTARMLGESVADVIQQFRSVRVLIAQAQLSEARARVRVAAQPVMITDADGRVLLATESLEALLGNASGQLRSVQDLLVRIVDRAVAGRQVRELFEQQSPWRAEIRVRREGADDLALMVRADAVFSAPEHVLGYIFLCTDLTAMKAAEDARQRFEEDLRSRRRGFTHPPAEESGYRDLLDAIVGNAQLAALELADGPDLARVPHVVAGVESSMSRTTLLLERLAGYAAQCLKDR